MTINNYYYENNCALQLSVKPCNSIFINTVFYFDQSNNKKLKFEIILLYNYNNNIIIVRVVCRWSCNVVFLQLCSFVQGQKYNLDKNTFRTKIHFGQTYYVSICFCALFYSSVLAHCMRLWPSPARCPNMKSLARRSLTLFLFMYPSIPNPPKFKNIIKPTKLTYYKYVARSEPLYPVTSPVHLSSPTELIVCSSGIT